MGSVHLFGFKVRMSIHSFHLCFHSALNVLPCCLYSFWILLLPFEVFFVLFPSSLHVPVVLSEVIFGYFTIFLLYKL